MRQWAWAILIPLVLLLAACGIKVPAEKSAWVGEWRAPGVSLSISQDGRVSWKRKARGASTSINAPLKAFHGNDFEIGIGPLTTIFKVSAPPYKVDGSWRMKVDGIELVRVDSLSTW